MVSNSNTNGNIDQIRDILFGDQIRKIQQQTEELKNNISEAISQLKEDSQKQIEQLENRLKAEIDQLSNRIDKNNRELTASIKKLKKSLSEQTLKTNEKTINAFQQQMQEIRNNKADRNVLAKLFSDFAKQLNE